MLIYPVWGRHEADSEPGWARGQAWVCDAGRLSRGWRSAEAGARQGGARGKSATRLGGRAGLKPLSVWLSALLGGSGQPQTLEEGASRVPPCPGAESVQLQTSDPETEDSGHSVVSQHQTLDVWR